MLIEMSVWREAVIGGSCHKYNFCRNKTCLLSRQKYACRDKPLLRQKYLSQQAYEFCRDKIMFVATNICRGKSFVVTNTCRDEHNFVMTGIFLSLQKTHFVMTKTSVCCDKHLFVVTKLCRNKTFTFGSSCQ